MQLRNKRKGIVLSSSRFNLVSVPLGSWSIDLATNISKIETDLADFTEQLGATAVRLFFFVAKSIARICCDMRTASSCDRAQTDDSPN